MDRVERSPEYADSFAFARHDWVDTNQSRRGFSNLFMTGLYRPASFSWTKRCGVRKLARDMSSRENVTIAPEWQELLRQRGLVSVDAVYQLREGTILKGGAATELRRVEFRDEKQTRVLYIKKYWYPTSRLRWSGFYRGTYFGTFPKCAANMRTWLDLRAWGLDAPSPVAYGEERRGGWLHRSFLISEGVPAPLSLDLFIREILPTIPLSERRRQRAELVRDAGRLHPSNA